MGNWKRLFYYLLINVIVSACTTLAVLLVWEQTHPQSAPASAEPVAALSTPSTTGAGGVPSPTPGQSAAATAAATATPTLLPKPIGPVEEYEVEDGDTLGLIAEKYDVSIEDIIRVNQISNPDSLSAGMLLYIPVPASRLPSPTAAPSRTPALTSTPSGPPQEARVIINSIIAPGDLVSEQVFLSRLGDGDLSLSGWQLKDEDGNVFTFPQLELFEGGAVIIWTKAGTDTAVDLYWGQGSPVWQAGEKATLVDASGAVHATYTIP
jgi:LysM repeat protein